MAIKYTAGARVIMPGISFTTTLGEAVKYVMDSDPSRQQLATIAVGNDAGTQSTRLGLSEIKSIAERPDFPKQK
jgi:hypothetical protein